MEQELLTLAEHLSSPPVFSGVHVTRSLVLYVCFVDCCLSFCTFSFGHCVVCSSSIYGFWLPLSALLSSKSSYFSLKKNNSWLDNHDITYHPLFYCSFRIEIGDWISLNIDQHQVVQGIWLHSTSSLVFHQFHGWKTGLIFHRCWWEAFQKIKNREYVVQSLCWKHLVQFSNSDITKIIKPTKTKMHLLSHFKHWRIIIV